MRNAVRWVLVLALLAPGTGCATALVQVQLDASREDALVVNYTRNEKTVSVSCREGTANVSALDRNVTATARRIEIEGAIDAWTLDAPAGERRDERDKELRTLFPSVVAVFEEDDERREALVLKERSWRCYAAPYARSRRWSFLRQLAGSALVVPAFAVDVVLSPVEAIAFCILWATHPHGLL